MVRRERRSTARILSEFGSHLSASDYVASRMTSIRWSHPDGTSFVYRHQFKDFDGFYAVVIPQLEAVVAFDLFSKAYEYAVQFDSAEIAYQLKNPNPDRKKETDGERNSFV